MRLNIKKGFNMLKLTPRVGEQDYCRFYISHQPAAVTLCLVDFNNGDVLVRNGDLFDDDILHLRHFVGE
ncbi:MAG: hypothetical protein K0S22_2536 [Oscillospiraceae bacterium]|nr:hypothetical protein [Oscillospiraceae bacterium]